LPIAVAVKPEHVSVPKGLAALVAGLRLRMGCEVAAVQVRPCAVARAIGRWDLPQVWPDTGLDAALQRVR
jgi:hypothetical protein